MTTRADEHGSLEDWERMWSLSKDKWFRHPRYQEAVAGILRKWLAGKVVLDVGCGPGDYLARLRDACTPVGVDISLEALKHAGGPRVIGSAESLPFRQGSLDGIYSIGTFHSLPHPEEMLREGRRVLGKGGLLILVVPSSRSLPGLLKRLFDPLFRLVFRTLENDRMPDIHRTYSLRELREVLSLGGYAVLEHHLLHIGYVFRSPLIRLPLTAIEKLRLRRMAEEIVIVCTPTS